MDHSSDCTKELSQSGVIAKPFWRPRGWKPLRLVLYPGIDGPALGGGINKSSTHNWHDAYATSLGFSGDHGRMPGIYDFFLILRLEDLRKSSML